MTGETEIQSFSAKWIIWLGIVVTIIGLLVLVLSSQENDKQTSERSSSRHLCGVFKLPADGRIVSQDVNGRELWYQKGEYVRFEQLGSPGKFTIINQKSSHPTWTTGQERVTSSRTKYGDKIQLRAVKGKELMVQAKIILRRS